MRDPTRIDRILALVAALWHKDPELRLIQLLLYVSSKSPHIQANSPGDPFYLEDEELERLLREIVLLD